MPESVDTRMHAACCAHFLQMIGSFVFFFHFIITLTPALKSKTIHTFQEISWETLQFPQKIVDIQKRWHFVVSKFWQRQRKISVNAAQEQREYLRNE